MNGTEAAALQRLFARLPRPDRLMLLLYYADELSPEEIGAVVRRPVGEVTRRLEHLRRLARLEVLGAGTRRAAAAVG